ncbi:hypothetical protein ACIBH1_09435 [Nonomuraea sp. NPDC050663]|uniref:hypothetical protein n=1 Tax=Nonomuraea sp. NPDC050663 TaxID=3364370 RepID=UPI0037ADAF12
MRRTAGVLALALAAITLGAAPAVASSPDCEQGGGLLGSVTGGLCELVDGVTDTVDDLTGDTLDPVTDAVDETGETVNDTLGEAAPTGTPQPSATPETEQPSPSGSPEPDGLLPTVLEDVCLPVLACKDQGVLPSLTGRPTPPPSDKLRPTAEPSPSATESGAAKLMPSAPQTPPASEPYLMNTTEHTIEPPPADPEQSGVELLLPFPLIEHLGRPLNDRQVVRPSERSSDIVGTALTAALLGSAALATHIAQKRRRREEEPASIPFEPIRVGGRHRLAGEA